MTDIRARHAARAALAEIQDKVHGLEPSLLRQPEEQIHGSIAWLLPVAAELGVVQSSLFRYSRPLADAAGLLEQLERLPVAVETEVSEVLIVREFVYPTLKYQVLRRQRLGGDRA